MTDRSLAATMMGIAILEQLGLLWLATTWIGNPSSDMALDPVFGFFLYLAVAFAALSAWMFSLRLREDADRWLWTGAALFLAPWTAVLVLGVGFWLGPVWWVFAAASGSIIPFALLALSLQPQ